jgi:hypothetical protein
MLGVGRLAERVEPFLLRTCNEVPAGTPITGGMLARVKASIEDAGDRIGSIDALRAKA